MYISSYDYSRPYRDPWRSEWARRMDGGILVGCSEQRVRREQTDASATDRCYQCYSRAKDYMYTACTIY